MHRDHGGDGGGAMWPHLSSNGGASCLGRWSSSQWSYMQVGFGDGVVVVMRLAGDDAAAAALRFALLWSRASQMERARERMNA